MKKIYSIIFVLVLSLSAFAQDTLIPARINQSFDFTPSSFGVVGASNKYFFGNPYNMTGQITGGFGQKFTATQANSRVTGVLVWIGKIGTSTNGDLTVKIQSLDGAGWKWPLSDAQPSQEATGYPGTTLGQTTKSLASCTAFEQWDENQPFPVSSFTSITFPSPVSVPVGTFAVTFNYVTANTGVFGTTSTTLGTAQQTNNDALVYASYAGVGATGSLNWWGAKHIDSQNRSIDVCIFPIITTNLGVGEVSMNGVTVNTYPNPATNNATIDYTLDNNANNVVIRVVDVTGKVSQVIENGSQAAGSYKNVLNVSNLSAGTYYISIEADYSRIATVLNVVR